MNLFAYGWYWLNVCVPKDMCWNPNCKEFDGIWSGVAFMNRTSAFKKRLQRDPVGMAGTGSLQSEEGLWQNPPVLMLCVLGLPVSIIMKDKFQLFISYSNLWCFVTLPGMNYDKLGFFFLTLIEIIFLSSLRNAATELRSQRSSCGNWLEIYDTWGVHICASTI